MDRTPPDQIAQDLLQLVASGRPVPAELLDQLAASVLQQPQVALAQQVAQESPHRLTRALELAALLLQAQVGARRAG